MYLDIIFEDTRTFKQEFTSNLHRHTVLLVKFTIAFSLMSNGDYAQTSIGHMNRQCHHIGPHSISSHSI